MELQLHIKVYNQSYAQALNGGGSSINCAAPWSREWETFLLVPVDQTPNPICNGARVRLRSYTGHRITCDPDGTLSASGPQHNSPLPDGSDIFTILMPPGDSTTVEMFGRFGLRASNGKYVCAENGGGGPLLANRPGMGVWETFIAELHPEPPNMVMQICLRTEDGCHFLHAKNGGGGELTAEATAVAQWETFDLLAANRASAGFPPNARVHLRSHGGYYVQALNGGGDKVTCAAPWGREWETFTLVLQPGMPALRKGDAFGLRTHDSHYLSASEGGGGEIHAKATAKGLTETFTVIAEVDLARVYGHLRKAILSRHFAVNKFFRNNFVTNRSHFGGIEFPKPVNRVLHLKQLVCHETEDFTGPDDCYLKIRVDGFLRPQLGRRMNNGETWALDAQYKFEKGVRIELWDEDTPDDDDFLGEATINSQIQLSSTARFTEDGARYTLHYSVSELNPPEVAPTLDVLHNCYTPLETNDQGWKIAAHTRENPLICTGQLLLCLAVEYYLGYKEALPIIRSALESLATLCKFSEPHFKGYMLRWDAVSSDFWTTVERNGHQEPVRCLQFLTDKEERYLYCTPFNHPDYITDKNNASAAQRDARYAFCVRYRYWEPSFDELNGLLMGYDIVYELVDDHSIRAAIKEQVTNLADYLAEHSYMLVRPRGGFTLRGASVPGPCFESPYGVVFQRITGDRFASRGGWVEAMKKAGLWGRIADAYNVATVGGILADIIDYTIPDALETIGFKLFWNALIPEVSKQDLARAAAIWLKKDLFDVLRTPDDDKGARDEFALSYLCSVIQPPPKRFDFYMALSARDMGGFATRMPRFLAITAAPLVHKKSDALIANACRGYVQQFNPPTEIMRTFLTAAGVLLEMGREWEEKLVRQLAQVASPLAQGLVEVKAVLENGKPAEDGEYVDDALDYMSSLALAWLYRKKMVERNNAQIFAPGFPSLPDMTKWAVPAVPRNIVEAAKPGSPYPKPLLPLHLIQQGRDAANLVYNSTGEAELFIDGMIPPKSQDPLPPAAPLAVVPDVIELTASQARDAVLAAGLIPRYRGIHANDDFVLDQNPRAGTQVRRGSTVTLFFGSGNRL